MSKQFNRKGRKDFAESRKAISLKLVVMLFHLPLTIYYLPNYGYRIRSQLLSFASPRR